MIRFIIVDESLGGRIPLELAVERHDDVR